MMGTRDVLATLEPPSPRQVGRGVGGWRGDQ